MAIADSKALLAEIMNAVDDHVTAKASRQLEKQIMDILDGYQITTMIRDDSGGSDNSRQLEVTMAEYIKRDAFLTKERAWYCENCDMRKNSKGKTVYEIGEAPCLACHINDLLDEVENCPAADVVERKTGKWLFWQDDPDANVYECSACHEPLTLNDGTPKENNFNYCPFCGLPMTGDDDDV